MVAVAYLRGDEGTVLESEVLPFGVKQSQADDRWFARPEASSLQCLDDRRTRIGRLQSRFELCDVEGELRAGVTGSPTGPFSGRGRHARRHPVD